MNCCRTMLVAALLALAAMAQQPLFQVRKGPEDANGHSRPLVTADRRLVSCLEALRELTGAVGWNLSVESQPLTADLGFHSVDLNLEGQDARIVAQLLAVAAGADVVFGEAAPVDGSRPTVHVVRPPDPATESGRHRLRTLAGQWYRSFLRDELQHEALVAREAVQVRMNLGQLMVDSGDLGAAIDSYTAAFEQRPHDFVGAALLKLSQCHLDQARSHAELAQQLEHYGKAEGWARRLFESCRRRRRSRAATVLLGRSLLGRATIDPDPQQRRRWAEQCQAELRARVIRLIDSVQMLDVWLLAGEAQMLLEQPERVYETMLTLRESAYFDELSPRQFLDYHFLLGYGTLGQLRHDLAMRALEWFLIHAEGDARKAWPT
jgi:hypothetical protein